MDRMQARKAKGAHIQITSENVLGRNARIVLDGQDISRVTRDIVITLPVDGIQTIQLEIIVERLELDASMQAVIAPYLRAKKSGQGDG